MTPRATFALGHVSAVFALVLLLASASRAQVPVVNGSADSRSALAAALTQQRLAAARAGKLEVSAAQASAAADKTAQATAALAARIQQAEAGVAAGEARIARENQY